jgi:hypothetical protein
MNGFCSPKSGQKQQAEYYEALRQEGHNNRDLFDRAYADALELYLKYTPPTITPL